MLLGSLLSKRKITTIYSFSCSGTGASNGATKRGGNELATINVPPTANGTSLCQECSQPIDKKGHFGRVLKCNANPDECTYSTSCHFAMANHMGAHRTKQKHPSMRGNQQQLSSPLFCR